uniref:Transcription initiation factor TFIID subunit 12 n=1 Tax=Molossus molossus TaxID=27622 RepID=A0A7J8FCJ3_MOLMO|nr:TATA-box binding protein associated factor 12 [Molossus molossus]
MAASHFTGLTAVADVIKDLDTQIALIGLGPHTSRKKQDLDKLYELKSKARQIMNQFGPSALINLSNFSSIKPEPASTPPQGSMANSTTVVKIPGTPGSGGRLSPENNQVLTKKKLQDLVREVDPNEQLDEDVEEMLLQIADDFIESVVTAACQLARHRKSSTLEVKDVQLHLGTWSHFSLRCPHNCSFRTVRKSITRGTFMPGSDFQALRFMYSQVLGLPLSNSVTLSLISLRTCFLICKVEIIVSSL